MTVQDIPSISGASGQGFRYIALAADTLPTAASLSGPNVGDRALIIDGPNKIFDGDSWEDDVGESLGSVSLSGPLGRRADAEAVSVSLSTEVVALIDGLEAAIALLPQSAGQVASTAVITVVADNAANVTILAANANRKGAIIFNTSTAILYIKFGATAVIANSWTEQIAPGQSYELPRGIGIYTGIIDGIWASDPGTGSAFITEW